MTLNERVLTMQDDLLACLQENLRIPSVEDTPAEGAPYGKACRESLDHVLKTAIYVSLASTHSKNQRISLLCVELHSMAFMN